MASHNVAPINTRQPEEFVIGSTAIYHVTLLESHVSAYLRNFFTNNKVPSPSLYTSHCDLLSSSLIPFNIIMF